LLSDDAQLVADGGGTARVVLKPLQGAERIARLFHVIARQLAAHAARLDYRPVLVNGELGLLRLFNGSLHSVLAFETADDRILSIGIVANPAKMGSAGAQALAMRLR
jgi:RNA polymerase sigma-70 factor (ECF subfamily)